MHRHFLKVNFLFSLIVIKIKTNIATEPLQIAGRSN